MRKNISFNFLSSEVLDCQQKTFLNWIRIKSCQDRWSILHPLSRQLQQMCTIIKAQNTLPPNVMKAIQLEIKQYAMEKNCVFLQIRISISCWNTLSSWGRVIASVKIHVPAKRENCLGAFSLFLLQETLQKCSFVLSPINWPFCTIFLLQNFFTFLQISWLLAIVRGQERAGTKGIL